MEKVTMERQGTVFGGALLIAGTSIGGGMLALPVITSLGGFIPSLVLYLFTWLFMAGTGLLFLEVCFWMKGETNIVSMAKKTLGRTGEVCAWLTYLFFFYCLTLAYMSGGGELFKQAFPALLNEWSSIIVFTLCFAPFVFAGAWLVEKVNVFLMMGLAAFYALFVVLGISYVDSGNLTHMNWSLSVIALPIAFASFGYQGIIPTLVHYMNYDVKRLRLAILIGSSIPFVTYVIWQWLIMGIVPTFGPNGLAETLEKGENAVFPLKTWIENPKVYMFGQFFAFFALATSFFGVTLGMLDFLADGLRIKKTPAGRLLLCSLVYLPPLFFAIAHPHVFIVALDYAGGFGSALLLGLLPILMVWSGRYVMKLESRYSLFGGRCLLTLMIAFVLYELICELRIVSEKF